MSPSRHAYRCALALVLAAWLPASAAPEAASEYVLRAVLMFNFIKFTGLPSVRPDDQAITLCIASSDPELLAAMEQLQGRQVRGQRLAVQSFLKDARCDALYVEGRARWQAIRDKLEAVPALTVGAYPGFIHDGGLVEVDIQPGRTRFDIDNAHAKRDGIRFYPQLLRLARRVVE